MKKYEGIIQRINRVKKEDLKMVCPFLSLLELDIQSVLVSPTICSGIYANTCSSNLLMSQTY
jgi:hypothetical protein